MKITISKSALVIDTPSCCMSCPLCQHSKADDIHSYGCVLLNDSITMDDEFAAFHILDLCPLRPIKFEADI